MRSFLLLLKANKSSTFDFAKYLVSSSYSLHTLNLYTYRFTSTEAFDNLVYSATMSKCLKEFSIACWHTQREQEFVLAERLAVVGWTLEEINLKYQQFISNEGALTPRNAICSSHNKQVKLYLSLYHWQTLECTLKPAAMNEDRITIASDLCIWKMCSR